jgi:hypothetical protein
MTSLGTLLSLCVENITFCPYAPITGKENFYMDLLLSMQAFMRSTNGGLAFQTWVCLIFIIKDNLLSIYILLVCLLL